MAQRIVIRRDTTDNWEEYDPVLAEGELGLDINEDKIKIGDGSRSWRQLDWIVDKGFVTEDKIDNLIGDIDDVEKIEIDDIVDGLNWILEAIKNSQVRMVEAKEDIEELKDHDNEYHSENYATVGYTDNAVNNMQSFVGFFYSIKELESEYEEGEDGWTAVILEERPLDDWDKENEFNEVNSDHWEYNEENNEIILDEAELNLEDEFAVIIEYEPEDFDGIDYEVIRRRNYIYDENADEITVSHKFNFIADKLYRLLYSDYDGRGTFMYSQHHEKWLEI